MTELIEVKTADLAGEALGWAVATTEGLNPRLEPPQYGNPWRVFCDTTFGNSKRYKPWEDWAVGGPLIVRYQVSIIPVPHRGAEGEEISDLWYADVYYKGGNQYTTEDCSTALVAACQAVVATKFGDTFQVPKELLP